MLDAKAGLAGYQPWSIAPDGAEARNAMQRLALHFATNGVSFADGGLGWGLKLRGFGRGAALTSAGSSRVRCEEARVVLAHNGCEEWYRNRPSGIEHGFTIAVAPAGVGEVRIALTLTNATARLEGDEARIIVGPREFSYGALEVSDAAGRHLPARLLVPIADEIAIAIDDRDAHYPLTIDPLLCDGAWRTGLGINGVNGMVFAALYDHGALYLAGDFTIAGTQVAKHVAKWNGTSWSALGGGTNGEVNSLAADAAGAIYAGGTFTTAGMVAASHVARWDGVEWQALGAGTDDTVSALAIDGGGNLYAAGTFITAGGITVNRIAKWNGGAWSALGSGLDSYGLSLASVGAGKIYVGGGFTTAGGVSASHIAMWNGGVWKRLGSIAANGVDNDVNAIVVHGNNVYAGGNFQIAGSASVDYVAKWNGSAWTGFAPDLGAPVYSLAVDAGGTLYAGGTMGVFDSGVYGQGLLARWDGKHWMTVAKSMPRFPGSSLVRAIASDATGKLFVGGEFTLAGGAYQETGPIPVKDVARFDGTQWSALGSGLNGGVSALAIDGTGKLYLGGDFGWPGAGNEHNVISWDGTIWTALGAGLNGSIAAVALDPAHPGVVYAGGNFDYYIQKWTGSAWTHFANNVNSLVRALAVDGSSNLYAGGDFTTAGDAPAVNLAKWNGTTWSSLGTDTDGGAALVLDAGGNLYAPGLVPRIDGGTGTGVRRWDGTAWTALGGPLGDYVLALALDGAGNLYAGGQFVTVSGSPGDYIAKWNGTAWSALGSDITGAVDGLAVDGVGNLYAACREDNIGTLPGRTLMRWDGTEWTTFGEGVNQQVKALARDAIGNLYAAGSFSLAGGVSAPNVARWDGNVLLPLGAGLDGPVAALAADLPRRRIYAAGAFGASGGTAVANIASWNGNAWSPLASGLNGSAAALLLDGGGDLYVGGAFTSANGIAANRVAKWNGGAWLALAAGTDGPVACLAKDGSGNLYVGGSFLNAGTVQASRVAKWNGSTWSQLRAGVDGIVTAAVCDGGGNLYIGGTFANADGILVNNIAEWDGTSWRALGAGVNGPVTVIAAAGGSIYIAGDFTTAGGIAANHTAVWNGSDWLALAASTDAGIAALVADGAGGWFAGGNFTHAGTVPAHRLAHWSGSAWSALPVGVTDARVLALAMRGSTLYAAGDFTTAGGTASAHLAAYDLPVVPTVAVASSGPTTPVSGTTAAIRVLGGPVGIESTLTYTWSVVSGPAGTPPGTATFNPNGSNAAKNATATFTRAGTYVLQATIQGPGGQITSQVTVTVIQNVATIVVTPATVSVAAGATRTFTASAEDQFGYAIASQLTYAWSVSGGGTVSPAGVFTATTVGGPFTVTAVSAGKSGTAIVTVTPSNGFAVKINFQPATAPPYGNGYLIDSSKVYGDRGNGYTYGWNAVFDETRDRNNASSPDQRYDTFDHMQKPSNPTAFWEIAVPNGSYQVHLVSGDSDNIDSVFKINVEGVLVLSGTPSANPFSAHWVDSGLQTVAVSDGRLTLTSATGSVNNKISFIEIVQLPSGVGMREVGRGTFGLVGEDRAMALALGDGR